MSEFFYKVTSVGYNVLTHKQLHASPITLEEFLENHNHQSNYTPLDCVVISETKLIPGENVFFLKNFLRADSKRYDETPLPVVVKGSTPQELKKDILSKMDLLLWHNIFDCNDSNFPSNRWEKLEERLTKELAGFTEDLCYHLPISFKMPQYPLNWNSDEEGFESSNQTAEMVNVKITLYKGVIQE